MNETKRVTANIPSSLLEDARSVTGLGITETIIEGLLLVKRRKAYQKAMQLKGKLNLELDITKSRKRSRS